jgi:hypothetical protein
MTSELTEHLAGVLGQCSALAHLDLGDNDIRDGAGGIVNVLEQCRALVHLDLSYNELGAEVLGRVAGHLAHHCPGLTHLNLSGKTFQCFCGQQEAIEGQRHAH